MVASTNNVAAPAATKKTESEIDRGRIRGGPNPWGAESVEAESAGGESVGAESVGGESVACIIKDQLWGGFCCVDRILSEPR